MRYNFDTKDFQIAHKYNKEILTFDDYKDLVYYVTYKLNKGDYKIIYNINYKNEIVKLEQKVIVKEE